MNYHIYIDEDVKEQAARMLNVSAQKGGEWSAPRCYQISVLNFEYDKGDKPPLAWYTMRKTDGGKLADRLNVIFLDLVKIRRLTDKNAESLTKLEKWGCSSPMPMTLGGRTTSRR